jgi:NAD+ kinase
MATPFKSIGIIGRVRNPGVKETFQALIDYLQKRTLPFYLEEDTAAILNETSIPTLPREKLGQECDLLIVVGGDGSLLHAAHIAVNQDLPVLGINRGSLGFLTDILPAELEKIGPVLEGHYHLEKRFLLTTSIELHGNNIGQDDSLNEVAIIPDAIPHMIEFEIYIDDQFVCSQNSDGLIIATPTGSTAYALSGGGPILHPQLDAMVLVPMFPHSLNSRPIVVEGNRRINVIITPNNTTSPRVSCDGRAYINTPASSHITIRKKPHELHLIHPLDYHYYEALRSKLHWGKKLKYTE